MVDGLKCLEFFHCGTMHICVSHCPLITSHIHLTNPDFDTYTIQVNWVKLKHSMTVLLCQVVLHSNFVYLSGPYWCRQRWDHLYLVTSRRDKPFCLSLSSYYKPPSPVSTVCYSVWALDPMEMNDSSRISKEKKNTVLFSYDLLAR